MTICSETFKNSPSNFEPKILPQLSLKVSDVVIDGLKTEKLFIFSEGMDGLKYLLLAIGRELNVGWLKVAILGYETHSDFLEVLLLVGFSEFLADFLFFTLEIHV